VRLNTLIWRKHLISLAGFITFIDNLVVVSFFGPHYIVLHTKAADRMLSHVFANWSCGWMAERHTKNPQTAMSLTAQSQQRGRRSASSRSGSSASVDSTPDQHESSLWTTLLLAQGLPPLCEQPITAKDIHWWVVVLIHDVVWRLPRAIRGQANLQLVNSRTGQFADMFL